MPFPIEIIADNTEVICGLSLPLRHTRGENRALRLTINLGGSPAAVSALVEDINTQIANHISEIREAAYQQGARDRALRARTFSGSWQADIWRSGCTDCRLPVKRRARRS